VQHCGKVIAMAEDLERVALGVPVPHESCREMFREQINCIQPPPTAAGDRPGPMVAVERVLSEQAGLKSQPMVSLAVVINSHGITRSSSFAVLRLRTRSHFCGNMTGSSSGFAPWRMRPA
jgi:hypothetical protein